VVIINEPLPRNAAGKFLKRDLQQQVVKGVLVPTTR
jgi:acyl-CoA synthetase (AMP-forming)/AMP-acid ligase II